jgi:hypothetical protein
MAVFEPAGILKLTLSKLFYHQIQVLDFTSKSPLIIFEHIHLLDFGDRATCNRPIRPPLVIRKRKIANKAVNCPTDIPPLVVSRPS